MVGAAAGGARRARPGSAACQARWAAARACCPCLPPACAAPGRCRRCSPAVRASRSDVHSWLAAAAHPRPPPQPPPPQVASATNDVAGDGTTTATVLTRAILVEGCKSVAAGMNPMDLRRGINLAVRAAGRSSAAFGAAAPWRCGVAAGWPRRAAAGEAGGTAAASLAPPHTHCVPPWPRPIVPLFVLCAGGPRGGRAQGPRQDDLHHRGDCAGAAAAAAKRVLRLSPCAALACSGAGEGCQGRAPSGSTARPVGWLAGGGCKGALGGCTPGGGGEAGCALAPHCPPLRPASPPTAPPCAAPAPPRKQVGTISANGEREIGELIARAMEKVGGRRRGRGGRGSGRACPGRAAVRWHASPAWSAPQRATSPAVAPLAMAPRATQPHAAARTRAPPPGCCWLCGAGGQGGRDHCAGRQDAGERARGAPPPGCLPITIQCSCRCN